MHNALFISGILETVIQTRYNLSCFLIYPRNGIIENVEIFFRYQFMDLAQKKV